MCAILFGCDGKQDGVSDAVNKVSLYADNEVIKADGSYSAKLTVIYTDDQGVKHDVTSESDIYYDGSDMPLATPEFKTTEEATYEFYAIYGFDISNTVSVRAVKGIPALPADEEPGNSSFKHRMLLLQHTGNECPNCPKMMTILKKIAQDDTYNTFYNHVASHSYNESDVAYSAAAGEISKNMNIRTYPMLSYNLTQETDYMESEIKTRILELHKEMAEVGLAVSATHVGGVNGKGGSVYASVSLKSAVSANYRVAVWLLEDRIHSPQSGADASWQNTHDNCLRFMCGNEKIERIYGKPIGTVEAGETHELLVAIDLENSWIASNCKLMVIAADAAGRYDLLNCVVCPVGGSISYDYI